MKLTGHKTESVYRRYAIADERDLRVAVERLNFIASARETGRSATDGNRRRLLAAYAWG